jgi:hypothetical protein
MAEDGAHAQVLGTVERGGRGLPADALGVFGSYFGADFSGVRVHDDSGAAQSAQAVGARAYTVGDDVVFNSGQFKPHEPEGRRLLAHELTHVVQQRSGPVSGVATSDGLALSQPSDHFEEAAEATALQFSRDEASVDTMPDAR